MNEVAKIGELRSRYRTKDQGEIAWFWADDTDSVSPPGRWDVIAQIAADRMQNTLEDNARLFALINIAMADAAICTWNCKYEYNLWRPITAIREANTDRNPLTTAVPGWTPLLPTPAFPAYTSGHSTFGAAAAEILIRFYGRDNFRFVLPSTSQFARTRYFKSFSEAAEENGISRIYGGIHFSFDNTVGLHYGMKIGDYAYENIMRPL
jgi:membrane-associated phospholipid phosphatase